MEKKGQVFSLDVMISIILIVLALGVAMRFLEMKATETKEITEQTELYRIGKTAAELLVNNPAIVCELRDIRPPNQKLDSLSNCIEPNQNIQQKELGMIINGDFDCRIEITYGGLPPATLPGQCQTAIPAITKNIYSATREIVVAPNKTVTKAELNACNDTDPLTICNLTPATVTIWVWK